MAENARIEELKRRVQVDPASIAFAALAEEYRRAGRFEEAIATCQAGLQRHPAYLSAHVTLGRALLETGQFDEARQELEHVLRAAPENLAAIRGLAEIHDRRGELPEALEQYRSALSVAKNDSELEATVEELSKRVAAPPGAPARSRRSRWRAGPDIASPPKPSPKPPPLELVTWVRADAESEPQIEPPIEFAPPFATQPAPESRPDPDARGSRGFAGGNPSRARSAGGRVRSPALRAPARMIRVTLPICVEACVGPRRHEGCASRRAASSRTRQTCGISARSTAAPARWWWSRSDARWSSISATSPRRATFPVSTRTWRHWRSFSPSATKTRP